MGQNKDIRKRIESHKQMIANHEEKILEESAQLKPRQWLIELWQKQIANAQNQIANLERRLRQAKRQSMATARKPKIAWNSDVLEILQQEIVELNHRYLVELDRLRQSTHGTDKYIEHWAEIDVILFWLQMKIEDARKEMERLGETWPE
jgi:hypothetical protein